MGWKERLEKLPLILGGLGVEADQCIEEMFGDAKLIAAHEYVPGIGAAYHFSFSGLLSDRKRLIEGLNAELGAPHSLDCARDEIWHYFWKSPSEEIPETLVHETLTRQRIREICQEHGLTLEEERIIDELLAVFRIFIGRTAARIAYLENRLGNADPVRRITISQAFFQINTEFARKRLL